MSARAAIRRITPPFLLHAARRVRGKITGSRAALPVWERVPEGWARAQADEFVRGWNVPSVEKWHRQRFELWSRAFRAPKPLGTSEYAVDSTEQYLHSHNVHVSFAYVLALAARNRTRLAVLDWGGGIGQYYLLARSVLPELELAYHCKDVPLICSAGRQLNPEVTFHDDETCLERSFDLVVASNSLQYGEDWRGTLGKLAAAAGAFLYVAQLPTVLETPSFVAVQRPYAHQLETEYLGWIFNQREFLAVAGDLGLDVVREFFFGNTLDVHRAHEPAVHRGFLLRPSA